MDFSLTENQKMLKKITREFAETYLVPVAKDSDEKQELDQTAFQKMKEMKYFGACIPEEYGGAGLHNDSIAYCIIVEEIGRADAAWGLSIAVHNSLATYPIYKFGTEEQKKKFLPDLAKGDKVGAFCLTEPDAGSDAGGVQLVAEKDGSDYILNGTKIFATNGGIANILLVIAKTGEKDGRKQLTVKMFAYLKRIY
jgi:butyryl-CoA dehydrogenase